MANQNEFSKANLFPPFFDGLDKVGDSLVRSHTVVPIAS